MGGSNDPLLGFDSLARMAHRTQGNSFTSLVKDVIKDTGEYPEAEMRRARSEGRGQSFHAIAGPTHPAPPCVHQPAARTFGILGRLPHKGMFNY